MMMVAGGGDDGFRPRLWFLVSVDFALAAWENKSIEKAAK